MGSNRGVLRYAKGVLHAPRPPVMLEWQYSLFSNVNPPAIAPLEPAGPSQLSVVLSLVALLFAVHGSIWCLMVRCRSLLRP